MAETDRLLGLPLLFAQGSVVARTGLLDIEVNSGSL